MTGTGANATLTPVGVLGAGSWGTALALLLARSGRPVYLWAHRQDHLDQMRADRQNARYLPDIAFPPNLDIVNELDTLATKTSDFVAVIPSHAFASTLENLNKACLRVGRSPADVSVTWGTKGFEPGTGNQLDEVVKRVMPDVGLRAIVSGPTFASEVAQDLPAAMAIAGSNRAGVERLAELFRSDRMRVYLNDDFVGVQTAGAIKNVMAIATGISDGLNLGANARAALITRGLAELVRLGTELGGRPDTFMGLAGVGDLVLTCTDDQSRNRRVGLGLGAGKSIEDIRAEIGQEAEGVNTCRELHRKSEALGVSMPVTAQVYQVISENKPPQDAVAELLRRDPRPEST